jgi:transposase InsO family protein
VLDIHPIMLYRWKKEYREGVIMKQTTRAMLDSETKRKLKRLKNLEKAHETLQLEHELLKKHPILFESKKEIFEFIDTQRDRYPLMLMCRVFDVSRFGYQSWKTRGPSARAQKDIELTQSIERIFGKSDGIYGSPKIHQALQHEGIVVGENRIARLMQENGLRARCARIYRSHVRMDRFCASIKNEIQTLEAANTNQIWVGDVTYLRVNNEWRYLAVILDLYSRRVVGWSLSRKRNVALSLAAFKRAAKKRLIQSGLYFHSDRGAEYVAKKYQNWLKKNGVIQSMNRKGVINDNAQMESFFHHFKAERIHRNEYTTEKELRAVIIEYVGFYNQRRLHSSLDYLTPNEYEVTMA